MTNRRFTFVVLGTGAGALAIGIAFYLAGYRINSTESLPPGIWRLADPSHAAHGDVIHFCPPDTPALQTAKARGYMHGGPCAGDYEPLFKPIVALVGDQVSLDAEGIRVNGKLVPNSAPMPRDGLGRPMPAIAERTYTVQPGTAWVVSSYTPWSFDSRYFGPIELASVDGRATPVWTSAEYHP